VQFPNHCPTLTPEKQHFLLQHKAISDPKDSEKGQIYLLIQKKKLLYLFDSKNLEEFVLKHKFIIS